MKNWKSSDGNACGCSRRGFLGGIGAAVAAVAVEKTTDGGYAEVTPPGVPERTIPVLPPSAESQRDFSLKCVGCGLCTKACPERVLRPSTNWKRFGQPVLDFTVGYCRLACAYKCGSVCPTGALSVPVGYRRNDVHPGYAVWHRELCIRTTKNENCNACVRKCPVGAIHLEGGFPVVDRTVCVGCGACEHVCPARPLPGMAVEGVEVTRRVKAIDEGQLVSEMKSLVASGHAVVTALDGVIESRGDGRGVLPVLTLLDEGKLKGRVVVDKVVGRAAAAVFIVGGVKRVYALVMSEDAATLLAANGIRAQADRTVPKILNRDRSGGCPLEAAVERLERPAEMVEALRARAR